MKKKYDYNYAYDYAFFDEFFFEGVYSTLYKAGAVVCGYNFYPFRK